MATVLEVDGVRMYPLENAKRHHTERYELIHEAENPSVILRRGQEFELLVKFRERGFDPSKDIVRLVFTFGKARGNSRPPLAVSGANPSPVKGTRAVSSVTGRMDYSKDIQEWDVRLLKKDQVSVRLEDQRHRVRDTGTETQEQRHRIKDTVSETQYQTQEERHRIKDTGSETQDQRHRSRDTETETQDQGHRIRDTGSETQEQRHSNRDLGTETQNQGHSIRDTGRETQDKNHRIKGTGLETQDHRHRNRDTGTDTQEQRRRIRDTGSLAKTSKILILNKIVRSPPDSPVGEWNFEIETKSKVDRRSPASLYKFPSKFYLLFNPWAKGNVTLS
uniref:Transglutaminase N-terminal domain-containing protein n=1 Tax=Timema monikensis TaxID=170555 RepID=A0A7R9HJS2_9NEOP|nr:unnamed protein product [Timema monikensis]